MLLHLQARDQKQLLQQLEPLVSKDHACCLRDVGCLFCVVRWISHTWEGV